MSKGVCEAINKIEEYITFDSGSQNYKFNDILKAYCPNQNCDSDQKILGSAFTALVEFFKNIDIEKPEDDILGQYAILWLSYKIRQNQNIEFIRNTIYDILKQNEWFSEHRQYTDKNKDIMGFHFLFLNRLYALLKGICETITNCNDPSKASECIESGKKCSDLYRTCIVQIPWAEICSPYCVVLSNLKNDYDKLRKNNIKLPELTPPEGITSCENFCGILKERLNAMKAKVDNSEMDESSKNSLSGILSGRRGNPLPGIGGQKDISKYIAGKSVNFEKKLKGEEGRAPVILGVHRNLRNSLQGLEGGSGGKYDVLFGQSSGFETVGGINPITRISHDNVKNIIGLTQGLKGEEGGIIDDTQRLPGLYGDAYGQSDGLRGQTDRLPSLEGDSNWKDSESNSHNGLKTIGGISPQMVGLSGHMDELPSEKDESLNKKHDLIPLKNESQNNSTTLEDSVNLHQKNKTLYFDKNLEHQSLYPISDSNPVLSLGSNLGDKLPYIVVPFILVLIIFGISYKYITHRRRKKMNSKKNMQTIINLCNEDKTKKGTTNEFIEKNQSE
ncbi:Plasmodium variant antigen protein Cir/Yir/Bir, putative [Plasmodium chabaudi adami]|uniref:Plasmodium variant antigen protein Cir/Yir/Bir, putative n=1 Tax=Plasmodium chabaudi adami TaxID=5826 RepID=A0A1C6WR40_PLACE|nr:Plasmodium variant antigen protein Cir/Yir/Bir, putative [Plasmodium chabaudi adami]